MTKMGIKPDHYTYSAMFNACANSPYRYDGLTGARKLFTEIEQKQIQLDETGYYSMINAFAVGQDYDMAYSLSDKMMRRFRMADSAYILTLLLKAASYDKERGFEYAVGVS